MRRKYKIVLATYITVGVLVSGLYIWQNQKNLADYRLAANYSASMAFEETVSAARGLSDALEKSVYAVGGSMSGKVCSEIYANALAAEAALSTLPFSTLELEQVSAFLNRTGDYAYTVNFGAIEDGFTDEQRTEFAEMSVIAGNFADYLDELRNGVNSGLVIMDSREADHRNVFPDDETEKLSARLYRYENEFQPMAELIYDGKHGKEQDRAVSGNLSREEMIGLAAQFAGVKPEELQKQYDYQGTEGRCCYSAGDVSICVSPAGVESMQNRRLVGEIKISREQAEKAAKDFLEKQGFENMELADRELDGAVYNMRFCKLEQDALCLNNEIKISVAMDNGAIHGLNTISYSSGDTDAQWNTSQEEAMKSIPAGLKCAAGRKVIKQSPAGRDYGCYEFSCADSKGMGVKVYVDADSGKQCDIVFEKK